MNPNEWIKVTDRLPEGSMDVLMYDRPCEGETEGSIYYGFFCLLESGPNWTGYYEYSYEAHPSHWMLLPEPPSDL